MYRKPWNFGISAMRGLPRRKNVDVDDAEYTM